MWLLDFLSIRSGTQLIKIWRAHWILTVWYYYGDVRSNIVFTKKLWMMSCLISQYVGWRINLLSSIFGSLVIEHIMFIGTFGKIFLEGRPIEYIKYFGKDTTLLNHEPFLSLSYIIYSLLLSSYIMFCIDSVTVLGVHFLQFHLCLSTHTPIREIPDKLYTVFRGGVRQTATVKNYNIGWDWGSIYAYSVGLSSYGLRIKTTSHPLWSNPIRFYFLYDIKVIINVKVVKWRKVIHDNQFYIGVDIRIKDIGGIFTIG